MSKIEKIDLKDLPGQSPFVKRLIEICQEMDKEVKKEDGQNRAFLALGTDENANSMVVVGGSGDDDLMELCIHGLIHHPKYGNLVVMKVTEFLLQGQQFGHDDQKPNGGIILN